MKKALFSIFLLLAIVLFCQAGDTVKIMPVGNSITAGEHYKLPALEERTGYRKPLYEMLTDSGYTVDFVGSQEHGIRSKDDEDWYDWNCEAYPGWKIPEISAKVKLALETYNPSILLVHVGTNGKDWDVKPGQVEEMLDMINIYSISKNKPVTVFLCQIINRFKDEDPAPTTKFNQDIANMVKGRTNDKIRIILVDMENGAGLDYSDDLPDSTVKPPYEGGDMWGYRYPGVTYDKYHPNDKGNTKMALKFYTELIKVLDDTINTENEPQIAFPGAEGYGKYAVGGRGGKVFEVTNLNSSGAGSFGAALSASGPRTVVFRVAGTIEGNFKISNGNITIAGQTAPGDGICIKGSIAIGADDVIIRYIRVRANPSVETDAIGGRYRKNIILDHISASWSSDEVMSLYHNENVTIQWCMITEACEKAGEGHRFGGIWGNPYGTYHHNLIAHNDSRNPRWASGCGYNDYRNNVLYNWGYNSSYGGEKQQDGKPQFNFSTINIIANYYKPGPGTQSGVKSRIVEPSTRSGEDDAGKWWVSDNVVEGNSIVTENNWKGVARTEAYFRLNVPWNAMPINQQTPEDAYVDVLAHAGCSKPNRDTIDKRIIEEVRNGTATYGKNGIITYPRDVGGWPALASGTPPVDSDHDGMPDSWETDHGLNPNNAEDRNTVATDGYTMLEHYLNSLTTTVPVSTAGVAIEPVSDSLEKNKTIQLIAKVNPSNATNWLVTWSSDNPSVATVDKNGLVKAVDTGTALIKATTKDGGFTDSCTIEVFTIPVTGITIDLDTLDLEVNKLFKLSYTVTPGNATNQNITWSSSDTEVVTVKSTGYAKGIKVGTAIISVTSEDGEYTATLYVNVSSSVDIVDAKSPTPNILVFPNPFSENVTVNFEGIDNVNSLEVLNTTGQVVKMPTPHELKEKYIELNLDMPGNFFLIKINTNKKTYTKKIIRR